MALWLLFFGMIWGSFSPAAPYGAAWPVRISAVATGLPGLFLDQEYGLLLYAPALLLAGAGLCSMWREGGQPRRVAIEVALAFGALALTVSAFESWWGGGTAPGRRLAPGLLLLGIPIAWHYDRGTAFARRRSVHELLLLVGLTILAALVLSPGSLMANARDGSARLLEWLSPDWPLYSLFPSFIYHGPLVATSFALVWGIAAAALVWILTRGGEARREDVSVTPAGRSALAALSVAAALVVLMAILLPLLFGARLQRAVPVDARSGSRALHEFDLTARPLALVYDPFRRVPAQQVPSLIDLVATPALRRLRQPVRLLLNGRFSLPAGRYAVELTAADRTTGNLALQVGREGPALSSWELTLAPGQVWQTEFQLPIDVNFLGFRASPKLERATQELRIRPLSIVDSRLRPPSREVRAALRFPSATIYLHDANAWAERAGFWTRGRSTAELTLAPTRRDAVVFRIHAGPTHNAVVLRAPGWEEQMVLPPRVRKSVRMPLRGQDGVIPLRIETAEGFTPALLDSGNADRRLLGCWIEVVDEAPSVASR